MTSLLKTLSNIFINKRSRSFCVGNGPFFKIILCWIRLPLSPQNDNVLFEQSRNVLLTAIKLRRCRKENY